MIEVLDKKMGRFRYKGRRMFVEMTYILTTEFESHKLDLNQ